MTRTECSEGSAAFELIVRAVARLAAPRHVATTIKEMTDGYLQLTSRRLTPASVRVGGTAGHSQNGLILASSAYASVAAASASSIRASSRPVRSPAVKTRFGLDPPGARMSGMRSWISATNSLASVVIIAKVSGWAKKYFWMSYCRDGRIQSAID